MPATPSAATPSESSSPSSTDTNDRILDAAEKLFALYGFNGTSVRAITESARVNLASANYHFGDKETLYQTVVRRAVAPLNTARLAALDDAERLAGDHPVPLRAVLDILVRPTFELAADPTGRGGHVVRLVGRSFSDPLPFTSALLQEIFDPLLARVGHALRRNLPHLSQTEFMWRLNFVMGSMQHTLSTLHRLCALTHGVCRTDNHTATLCRFLDFAEGAFAAPVTLGVTVSAPSDSHTQTASTAPT